MAYRYRHPLREEYDDEDQYQEAVKLYEFAEDAATDEYIEEQHS